MESFKKYWPLFLIFLVCLAIFSPVFSLYFSQDDFFHLKMAKAENFGDFLNFFSLHNPYGYAFYRPLTTQVYNFFLKSLFGLNPFSFHLFSFIFFWANLFLVFKIVEKLLKNKNLGFFASFLYGISASNLGSLSYISAFEEIAMAFFFFLTFWFYLEERKLSILTFVFALLSRENALVLPLILIFYELFLGKKNFKKTLPFWLILGVYGLLRIWVGLPDISVYQPVFAPEKILNSYFWYLLWGIGLPEMLVDFVGPGLKISPKFILWYPTEAKVMFGAGLLFLILLAWGILKSKKEEKKKEAFFLVWFIIALFPVVFWPWHKFSYYLTVPLLGLVSFFVLLLKNLPKVFFYLGILAFVIVSLVTIKLSWKTYWVITRAKIAQSLVEQLKQIYPILPKGAIVYFQNDPAYPRIAPEWGNSSTQAYYALSGKDAVQLLYNDPAIKVYYEDLEKPPEGADEIFPVVAKIIQ